MTTILGVMIFIGILFSAVVPMFLVMKQADTIYDTKKLEMSSLDEERSREALDVYAFPMSQYSNTLNITVENNCEVPLNIVRCWVNNTYVSVNTSVPPMSQIYLSSIQVSRRVNATYDVFVATDRGNIFSSSTGTLRYGSTGWETELLGINVVISYSGIIFRVQISRGGQILYDEQLWKLLGSVMKSYDVSGSGPGTYHVKIQKSYNGWTTIYDKDVVISWPSGPSVVWVYV